MAIAQFPTATQRQSWTNTMQKELIKRSPWEQMSNIVVETQEIPNKSEMKMVPNAVMIKLAGEFDQGSYALTIPMVGKLNRKGTFGRQPADGTEEAPDIRFKTVHYNVERKAISKEELSVDGQPDQFYKIGAMGTPMITNYFVEMTDFNCHRAVIEGASWNLTETEAWGGPSFPTAPQVRKYNPTVMKRGGTALVSYSTVLTTFEASIQAAVDTLTTASNPMSLTGLDALCAEMSRRLVPLQWKGGIDYVLLLSDYQVQELQDASTTNGWSKLMQAADGREGDKENRAISGVLGVYRRVLLIQNSRAPIWNTAGSANAYVGYLKPWSSGGHFNAADAAVTRAAKTTTGAGTCEIAIGLGKGGIGNSIIRKLGFEEMERDYNFNKGLCGGRMAGWCRMDFDITTPTATSIRSQTTLLYFTPSPSVVF